jgi:hypothetical protein
MSRNTIEAEANVHLWPRAPGELIGSRHLNRSGRQFADATLLVPTRISWKKTIANRQAKASLAVGRHSRLIFGGD